MDRLEAIEKLARLRDSGVLTEAEYAEQKRILMSSTSASVIPAPVRPNRLHGSHIGTNEYESQFAPPPTPQIHIHNTNTQAASVPAYSHGPRPYFKSTLVAYLLWFFLFPISAHRLYLHRWGTALLQIFWGVIAFFSAISGGLMMGLLFGSAAASAASGLLFFAVMMGIWGLWWLLDAILIPGMVDRYNSERWG